MVKTTASLLTMATGMTLGATTGILNDAALVTWMVISCVAGSLLSLALFEDKGRLAILWLLLQFACGVICGVLVTPGIVIYRDPVGPYRPETVVITAFFVALLLWPVLRLASPRGKELVNGAIDWLIQYASNKRKGPG